jgi:hypothetical protein
MGIFSFLVLILLSLVGYSAGVTIRSRKFIEPKPRLVDLVLVAIIWIGAIYSRAALSVNRWLLILVWFILGLAIGYLSHWPQKTGAKKLPSVQKRQDGPGKIAKRFWNNWSDFSKKMGNFQSRILLSFFFFIFVTPIALLIRAFADPLRIKPGSREIADTHWLTRRIVEPDIAQYRRQF